jgi:hypothetical protein
VLLVGGAEAAVIRADVIGTHVEVPKFLTGVQIAANTFVVLNVGAMRIFCRLCSGQRLSMYMPRLQRQF